MIKMRIIFDCNNKPIIIMIIILLIIMILINNDKNNSDSVLHVFIQGIYVRPCSNILSRVS